jgi:hypothetical protein
VNPILDLFYANRRGWAFFEISWLALLRVVANRHLKRPLLEIVTTPLAAWGVMALGIVAIYRRRQGQKINWKGRFYTN